MKNRKIEDPAPTKGGKRLLKIFLTLIIVIMALIALLPTIASTAPVRNMIVGRINSAIDGKLGIDSWSFGWFTHNRINGITFSDQAQGLDARVKEISISKGLLAILGSNKKF